MAPHFRLTLAALLGCALVAGVVQAQVAIDQAQNPQPKGGALIDAPPPAPAREPELSPTVAAWLRQINAYRAAGAQCGSRAYEPAPPLRWNAQLEQAALLHSRDQASRNTLSHEGADGSDIGERMNRQNYAWRGAAENVAAGQRDMMDALAGWMRSPGHCANMMGKSYAEVGVASAPANGTYSAYYTMVLGTPGGGTGGVRFAVENLQATGSKAILDALNALRAQGGKCGDAQFLPAPPFIWNEKLERVARWDATSYVDQKQSDDPGPSFSGRMRGANFFSGSASSMGGSGGAAPLLVLQNWLGDASKCKDLLRQGYTHIGMAGAKHQRANSHWWSLVLATPMFGDRIADTGPVDRGRTDHAVALEVVNAIRAKGAVCKGEAMPPAPPVATHPALEAAVQAVADAHNQTNVNWAQILGNGGLPIYGGAMGISGFGAHGLVLAIEDWATGSYCQELLSPKLAYLGARAIPTVGSRTPNHWHLILVNSK